MSCNVLLQHGGEPGGDATPGATAQVLFRSVRAVRTAQQGTRRLLLEATR